MKTISAVITARNDNYGGHLTIRATHCIQNFIERYDEVIYVDWNSTTQSLLDEIKPCLKLKKNLTHIKVTSRDIEKLNPALLSIPIVDVLGRNIGIRRAKSDFIVSTNIDIIAQRPDLTKLDLNTMYTAPRRNINQGIYINNKSSISLGNMLIQAAGSYPRALDSVDSTGNPTHDKDDIWSLVVSCGDFQLAYKDLWYKIKGFEEEMIYRSFADSNIMKKGFLYGKISKLDLPVFHLDHTYSHPNSKDTVTRFNEKNKYIKDFYETTNSDDWGFKNYNFETEKL